MMMKLIKKLISKIFRKDTRKIYTKWETPEQILARFKKEIRKEKDGYISEKEIYVFKNVTIHEDGEYPVKKSIL